MINHVRNIVLAVINKENRGYITPEEFNLFCRQAQLEIFEDYFYEYNRWLNKGNKRLANSEYSDIPKNIREKIDVFSTLTKLTYSEEEEQFMPDENIYRIETVIYKNKEVDEENKNKILDVLRANISAPTVQFPIYIRLGRNLKVYPEEIVEGVSAFALRRPKNPKWTYFVVGGNPIYNPSAGDFQDLEIHPSDEVKIVIKVLSYAGISIREMEVVQLMENMDTKEFQKDNS